ncbi:MAG TPA: GNAT family N-acetyltransferase [Anaerolineales bacterium]|nr:GNAT family N-acetyltransferase [Anaerolineales bacterium]
MKTIHSSSPPFTSRQFAGLDDLQSIVDMLMVARQHSNDWHYAHVGEFLFNFFMVDCHLDPRQHVRLWHNSTNRLIAYAILGEDPSFECYVLPEYEWIGIEEDAFAWAGAYLEELRQKDAARWGGEFASGSRQDNHQRIAFLESLGFSYSGTFAEVNMIRSSTDPVPQVTVPDHCRVCSMAEYDVISDRAAAERDVWLPWTVGNITDEDYVRFMQLPGYHPDLDVVTLTPDGRIAAYVVGWVDPLNLIGDFGPVGTRLEYRRQGFARLALVESLRRMQTYGMNRVCISTGINNIPALNLYTSLGFTIVNRYLDYTRVSKKTTGLDIKEGPHGWNP